MTRIRFRTDSWWHADDVARMRRGQETLWFDPPDLEGVEPAQPGDCWRVRWAQTDIIAGYAIGCPQCLQVHSWTTATNCASLRMRESGVKVCDHSGVGSCWTWTGSGEDGTLTAMPSLWAKSDNPSPGLRGYGCGWHGYLRNGVLTHV